MTSDIQSSRPVEFWSSVGGSGFLGGLRRELTFLGHISSEVCVLSEQDYRRSRGAVGRLWLRWQLYFGLLWRCGSLALGRRTPGIRIVTTNPFFMPALVVKSSSRSDRTVLLLYDLFPDVLVLAGKIRPGGFGERQLARITRFALRESDVTVFLGERLRDFAQERFGRARQAAVIHVGADGNPFRNSPPVFSPEPTSLTVLYAGAMGHMHEIDTLLDSWRAGDIPGINWRFHSSGVGYSLLRAAHARESHGWRHDIVLADPLPGPEWEAALRSCPISLVTLKPGAENLVMPSKTYSALVAGQAILAVCPRDSDLADLVRGHDCGWVVEPGDVDELRRILREITASPDELQRKRMNAFREGHAHYDVAVLAKQWIQLFDSLTAN